jgi:CheY-like chemotaxis protein
MRILVVEDDEAARAGLLRVLKDSGHVSVGAWDVASAIRQLAMEAAVRPELVLLDVHLGDKETDGIDLARLMRDDDEWRRIPIIITSGTPPDEVRQRARTNAFEGLRMTFVEKPISVELLLHEIKRISESL